MKPCSPHRPLLHPAPHLPALHFLLAPERALLRLVDCRPGHSRARCLAPQRPSHPLQLASPRVPAVFPCPWSAWRSCSPPTRSLSFKRLGVLLAPPQHRRCLLCVSPGWQPFGQLGLCWLQAQLGLWPKILFPLGCGSGAGHGVGKPARHCPSERELLSLALSCLFCKGLAAAFLAAPVAAAQDPLGKLGSLPKVSH